MACYNRLPIKPDSSERAERADGRVKPTAVALRGTYWIGSDGWYPRLTEAMIFSGSAVQTKGFGSSLVSRRKRLIAAWRSTIEQNTPRLRRRLVSLAKKPSTALSQEAEVGV